MRTISVNNINNQNFRGLWKEFNKLQRVHERGEDHCRINQYFPFSDESEASIKKAVDSQTYGMSYPMRNSKYSHSVSVTSIVKIMDRLPFTQAEYNAYKSFFGEMLPESLLKIEKFLFENKFLGYLNGGGIYTLKRMTTAIKHK
ncbi:hypothetical protein IJ750_00290 [bacterium]|nr:hypothetical protein [bacterium]